MYAHHTLDRSLLTDCSDANGESMAYTVESRPTILNWISVYSGNSTMGGVPSNCTAQTGQSYCYNNTMTIRATDPMYTYTIYTVRVVVNPNGKPISSSSGNNFE